MKSWRTSINIYLCAAAALLAGGGCDSPGKLSLKKDYATLHVFLEAPSSEGTLVYVGRDRRPVYVANEPFITEEDLGRAQLVDSADGTFAIRVTFSDHGGLVLDMNTTGNRGKHMVFFCQLRLHKADTDSSTAASDSTEKPGSGFTPWVGMMLIRTGITGGSIQFTPDITHDQAELLVRSLNNMVGEINKLEN